MTPEQKAAFINAQASAATCERMAMAWQNLADTAANRPLTYSYADFMALIDRYQLGYNDVVGFFHGG